MNAMPGPITDDDQMLARRARELVESCARSTFPMCTEYQRMRPILDEVVAVCNLAGAIIREIAHKIGTARIASSDRRRCRPHTRAWRIA